MDRDDKPAAAPAGPKGARDLVNGPIAATLLAFAMPTLGSNLLQSLNASINAIWVGRFLGETALAATSNANLVLFLMMASIMGFAMASTILVGQAVGRRDIEAARRAMGTATGLFAIVATASAVIGWLAAPAILRLLATPLAAQPLAVAYLRVVFIGMPGLFLVTLIGMGLRGAGDSTTPFYLMIINVVLDAGLNPVFILGLGPAPRLGIAGSALATTVASYLTLAGLIGVIYARDLSIRLRGAELRWLRPDRALMRTILSKGLPIGLQMFVVSAGSLAVIGLVNHGGVNVTAAYGVAAQLWTYVQMPALAVSAAVSAMAAQNIGADRWDRVGRITLSGIALNLALTGGMVLALLLLDHAALALFLGDNPGVIRIAEHINVISCWSFMLFGVTIVIFGTVRANGAVVAPLVILAISMFPIRLTLAVALMPLMGVEAIWWTMPIGSGAAMLMALAYYRAGRWRRIGMDAPPDPAEAQEEAACDAVPAGHRQPAV